LWPAFRTDPIEEERIIERGELEAAGMGEFPSVRVTMQAPFVIVVVNDVFLCTRFGSFVKQLFAVTRRLCGIISMRATKAMHAPLLSGLRRPRSPEALQVARDADNLTQKSARKSPGASPPPSFWPR
jgi:hypothetical protein